MVPFGKGQCILGGTSGNGDQSKIYHITCTNQICSISTLIKQLSVPRFNFVAIPIPDSISECISDSKFSQTVTQPYFFIPSCLFGLWQKKLSAISIWIPTGGLKSLLLETIDILVDWPLVARLPKKDTPAVIDTARAGQLTFYLQGDEGVNPMKRFQDGE